MTKLTKNDFDTGEGFMQFDDETIKEILEALELKRLIEERTNIIEKDKKFSPCSQFANDVVFAHLSQLLSKAKEVGK